MVKRIHVLVEGFTEETFVNMVLAPHLVNYNIFADATSVYTKIVGGRRAYRGGVNSYGKIKNDLVNLLKGDPSACAVTTMFDYYAFPTDIPGYDSQPTQGCYEKANYLENQIFMDVNDPRLIPNLLVHEFEALLFSDPTCIATVFNGKGTDDLNEIVSLCGAPENINNSPETAPSKRLLMIYPNYSKVLHCSLIIPKIGLDIIRVRCPHFNNWLNTLENL